MPARAVPAHPVPAGPDHAGQTGPCLPGTKTQIVCAENGLCSCPLSGAVTDAERAVMNDISRSAARLAKVLAWIFTLAAVAATILVVLR